MQIVLRKDVDSLGQAGAVVQVAPGYARNYLFPQKLAVPATSANLRQVAEETLQEQTRLERLTVKLQAAAGKLSKVSITAPVKVGEDDKVFGSVTSMMIAELVQKQGFDFDHHDIALTEPLKALGQYDVEIKLGHGISGTIKVWVVRE
ncbi:MAG: 50S ribosomal protein L9 [Candidatus Neomarinimicrobiota bacterium]